MTDPTGNAAAGDPIEREAKFGVEADFVLPSLEGLGVTVHDEGVLELDATYYDTAGALLGQHRHSLRRRRGVAWTLKGPSTRLGLAVERIEREWPDSEEVPAEAMAILDPMLEGEPLLPEVRLHTSRHVMLLTADQPLLEVVDDQVDVLDGERVVLHFREVEAEIRTAGAAAEVLLEQVGARLVAAGAIAHDLSKHRRALIALGRQPAPPAEPPATV
jgi:inorganic triphosphatase YgiF